MEALNHARSRALVLDPTWSRAQPTLSNNLPTPSALKDWEARGQAAGRRIAKLPQRQD
jgi:hypothetical protein